MNDLLHACEGFLKLLPEHQCDASALARALSVFGLSPAQLGKAARLLPEHHDLKYLGIRLLIAEYIRRFTEIFSDDGRQRCEVTVPAPLFLVMAFQQAANERIRFSSDALIAQIVLRSFFLYDKPIDEFSSSKRLCGLNRMRKELIDMKLCRDYLMQFGVLCDECLKCGEASGDRIKILSICYPKGNDAKLRELVEASTADFIKQVSNAMDLELGTPPFQQYGSLVKLQNALLKLNRRPDRQPLKGNSFALAQTVQLTVMDGWQASLRALELLVGELRAAPAATGARRFYCFYTPFLQPWIDAEFRKNGIELMGSAVFLYESKRFSIKPEQMTADWLFGLNVREDALTEISKLADEIQRNACIAYLTGMFAFDRWMGANSFLKTELLQTRYSIKSFHIDSDFWGETKSDSVIRKQLEAMAQAQVMRADS